MSAVRELGKVALMGISLRNIMHQSKSRRVKAAGVSVHFHCEPVFCEVWACDIEAL